MKSPEFTKARGSLLRAMSLLRATEEELLAAAESLETSTKTQYLAGQVRLALATTSGIRSLADVFRAQIPLEIGKDGRVK